jgi:hypothetical protein
MLVHISFALDIGLFWRVLDFLAPPKCSADVGHNRGAFSQYQFWSLHYGLDSVVAIPRSPPKHSLLWPASVKTRFLLSTITWPKGANFQLITPKRWLYACWQPSSLFLANSPPCWYRFNCRDNNFRGGGKIKAPLPSISDLFGIIDERANDILLACGCGLMKLHGNKLNLDKHGWDTLKTHTKLRSSVEIEVGRQIVQSTNF